MNHQLDPDDYPSEVIDRYQAARAAFIDGETEKAIQLTTELAEEGYPFAQHVLGSVYVQSADVEHNPELARKWLTAAADNGFGASIHLLGLMELNGVGCPRSPSNAMKFFMKGMELKDPHCALMVGELLADGRLGEPNMELALPAYWQAAEAGVAQAQQRLGYHYNNAPEVIRDVELAAQLYKAAADQGDDNSAHNLALMITRGDAMDGDLEQAKHYYTIAAEKGYVAAQQNLAALLANNAANRSDLEKSAYWFQQAAENGSKLAMHSLSNIYARGEGVEKDMEKSEYWRNLAENTEDPLLGERVANGDLSDVWVQNGLKALVEKKNLDAIAAFEAASRSNNPAGLFYLGQMYEDGLGVEADFNKAFKLYVQAADLDYPEAMGRLAFFYLVGEKVPQDFKAAANFHIRAALQGLDTSQCDLGRMYQEGIGVERDLEQAAHWYFRAAVQGHALSQFRLGQMFFHGHGTDQDFVKAIYWHEQAAKLGYVDAQCELARLKQDQHHPDLRDPDGAIFWARTAAEQGSIAAIAQIGYCYEHGIGVEKDLEQAASHYAEAASKGNWGASFSLGTLYEHGEGVPQDFNEARRCYEIASAEGHASALHNLGRFYQFGLGVAPNFSQAFDLYLKAAERGHAMSQLLVGQALLRGQEGTPVDETAGFAWMLRAAQRGVFEAQEDVGFRYMTGRGVEADAEQAEFWNRQAATRGHPRAQCMLAYSIIRSENADRDSLVEAAKWLILAFNQPDNLDEQLSGFINQEWQNVCSRLNEDDINEAQQQADAVLAGE